MHVTLARLCGVALVFLTAGSVRADVPAVVSRAGNLRLSPLQVGAGLVELLQLPAVQEELDLTPKQQGQIAELVRRIPPDRYEPAPAEHEDALPEELEKKQAKIAREVRQILTYRQWTRLNQLRLQSLGVGALFAPEVELTLGITRHQRLVAQRIVTRARSQTQSFLAEHGVKDDSGLLPPELQEKVRAIWEVARQEGFQLLSEQQRLILSEMLGEYFSF